MYQVWLALPETFKKVFRICFEAMRGAPSDDAAAD
jgi:hypothetical protein